MSGPGRREPLPPLDPSRPVGDNHYWRYHGLEALLACKKPVTASQDEDLFITVHQVCELAFHQMILDLDRALEALRTALGGPSPGGALDASPAAPEAVLPDVSEVCYFLDRVVRLYGLTCEALPVLTTLRGFVEFRAALGPSSGFQSYQFRRLELMSGVGVPYWNGGTRDAAGTVHPAEVEFERVFGEQVASWRETYRQHNLRWYFDRLIERAPGASVDARVATLRRHRHAGALLGFLDAYEKVQLRFHRVHLGLAVQQLAMVGVESGTGGTAFKQYLSRYEREVAPLFPGLDPRRPAAVGDGAGDPDDRPSPPS